LCAKSFPSSFSLSTLGKSANVVFHFHEETMQPLEPNKEGWYGIFLESLASFGKVLMTIASGFAI
jgi:hypothetical protein